MKLSLAKIVERYIIPYGLQLSAFISTLFLISPIIWMVSTSVKNEAEDYYHLICMKLFHELKFLYLHLFPHLLP